MICGLGPLDVALSSDPQSQANDFDVVIDFTIPSATLALARVCSEKGNAMVVGTTGFNEQQSSALEEYAQKQPYSSHPI